MLVDLLYLHQYGNTPLHLAAKEGHTTCVEHLLSTPDIDVNIKNKVSQSIEGNRYCFMNNIVYTYRMVV